jgi:hypothetical protein
MVWQFGELGYDYTIDYNGRTGEKPIRWDYYSEPGRYNLNRLYSALIKLRLREPLFSATDFQMDVQNSFKRIQLHKADNYALVLGNFGVASQNVSPVFPHAGQWYEYLTGDSVQIDNVNATMNLAAGEYHLYVDKKMLNPDFIDTTWIPHAPATTGFSNVYPNPSTGEIYAAINLGSQSETEVDFEVYDMTGQDVSRFSENVTGNKIIRIDGRGYTYTSGVFMIRIKAGDNKSLHKIVIK